MPDLVSKINDSFKSRFSEELDNFTDDHNELKIEARLTTAQSNDHLQMLKQSLSKVLITKKSELNKYSVEDDKEFEDQGDE
jgi:hypothetical protein